MLAQTGIIALVCFSMVCGEDSGVHLGDLKTRQHNTQGSLYAFNDSTIVVKNFAYDGDAPDAFFWVGTQGNKPSLKGTILPYPFTGKFFEYSDKSSPKLQDVYDGNGEDMVLTLPKNLKVSDLKWFSVWCRKFEVVLGELIFNSERITFPGSEGVSVARPNHSGAPASLYPSIILICSALFFKAL